MPNTAPTLLELSNAAIPLNREKAALILIDYQNEYTEGDLRLDKIDSAIEETAKLLSYARQHHIPVVHIAHKGKPGAHFDTTGKRGEIIPVLAPQPGEVVLFKTHPNSFFETGLDGHLKKIGKQHLIFAGLMAHMCLSTTVRAALDLGYASTVVASTTATRNLKAVNGKILSAEQIKESALAELKDRFAGFYETVSDFARAAN